MNTIPDDTRTVTASINNDAPVMKEKFNVGAWIIAATSVMNNQAETIDKLKSKVFWLQVQIVLALGAIVYIWK